FFDHVVGPPEQAVRQRTLDDVVEGLLRDRARLAGELFAAVLGLDALPGALEVDVEAAVRLVDRADFAALRVLCQVADVDDHPVSHRPDRRAAVLVVAVERPDEHALDGAELLRGVLVADRERPVAGLADRAGPALHLLRADDARLLRTDRIVDVD